MARKFSVPGIAGQFEHLVGTTGPLVAPLLIVLAAITSVAAQDQSDLHRLQIDVSDVTGERLPCRIHLKNANGEPQRAVGQPFWNDHFVCSGRVAIDLASGDYRYEIERGPEYDRRSGNVTVAESPSRLTVTMKRVASLRSERWYSGDLHVHRPIDEIELLMRAEDLDFAPVITWWNNRDLWNQRPIPDQRTRKFDGHRIYNVMAGEDEREGGALLYFGLQKPLDISAASREVPSPMRFVRDAKERNANVWIDIEKPFWWDVPVWLAMGQMQSIGIANNHMCRSGMLPNEAWGRPRDSERLPEPRGNGYWTQEIYYHMLNCGIDIPPSAGSASGVLPNPVGYNRVYVHLGDGVPFSSESWFAALARGNSFVTNGPLLIATADDHFSGHRFVLDDDHPHSISLDLSLTSIDRVSKLEVIRNGIVVSKIDCSDELTQRHRFDVDVSGGGWFLIRAVADVDPTFRFAATAPWFVQTKGSPSRVSGQSAQFFLDWVRQRIGRLQSSVTDPVALREVIGPHEMAEAFWLEKVAQANAP